MIRKILASFVSAHGEPESDRRRHTRLQQSRLAVEPLHHVVSGMVAERIEALPDDEGVANLALLEGPIARVEANGHDATPATGLPQAVRLKAIRCLDAPLNVLIGKGVVLSSEAMAKLVPVITSHTRAAAIQDPELRRVYEAVYLAFRKRRSLLLLNLESQVRLQELPWISAIEPWVGSDDVSREAARATMVEVAILAIESFPHTIIPNKLVKELQAMNGAAAIGIPLVEELAADIFMGAFTEKFLLAAKMAADLLTGSLYERYFGVAYADVIDLDDVERPERGAPRSPGFARMCVSLAHADSTDMRAVTRNGMLIEQAEILTTHNLAALFAGLDLGSTMHPHLEDMARRCFAWICHRQQSQTANWHANLIIMKNTAYAWRQMIFFISLMDADPLTAFLAWADAHLTEQRPEFRQRFMPAMVGLHSIADGAEFDDDGGHAASGGRRFLGWSAGRHWLMAPQSDGA